jgi:cell division protein FtsQ
VLGQYHLFRAALASTGLGIAELVLDERRSWRLTLDNNLRLRLGRRQVQARLGRFGRVYHSFIKPQLGRIESVDLRYTNGFSVAWKEPSPERSDREHSYREQP